LAEIEWANGFPTDLLRFQVRLLNRLRAGEYEQAARLAGSRDPDMSLSARDEVLLDLLRFVARPDTRTEGDAALLHTDLARTPGLTRWLDAAAPGLRAAFERAAPGG
jgi:hypothetical protein